MAETMGMTRRHALKVGGTFAGYALSVETVLAQAVKTDTSGILAGDFQVKVGDLNMPVYEARPESGKDHPIILVISEIWGCTSTSATPPDASPRRATTPSRPSSSSVKGAWLTYPTCRMC